MKKLFTVLLLVSVFTFFPYNVEAMLRVDENGNPITEEVKEGEFTIMSEPSDGQDGNVSSEITPEEKARDIEGKLETTSDDTPVSNDDIVKNEAVDMTTTSVEDGAELYATSDSTKKDNDLLYIIFSSFAGLSLGSIGTYFFMSKKR